MANLHQSGASQKDDIAETSGESENRGGLLLVGHGTRDVQGVSEFFETAGQVAQLLPGQAVEPCFLEFAEPTIDRGVQRLAERGVQQIVVVPVLLFSAGHARRDIPAAVATACARYGLTLSRQMPPLGCQRQIVDLSQQRFDQVVATAEVPLDEGTTWLIMVGRGSRDAGATAEMRRFAALRGQRTPGVRVWTCFYAMAEPSFVETLRSVASEARAAKRMAGPTSVEASLRHVIVQPHLLYHGQLASDIRRQVAKIAEETDDLQWLVTEYLGPDPAVAEVIVDVVRQDRRFRAAKGSARLGTLNQKNHRIAPEE